MQMQWPDSSSRMGCKNDCERGANAVREFILWSILLSALLSALYAACPQENARSENSTFNSDRIEKSKIRWVREDCRNDYSNR